ncbi:MAG TPA: peptide chain release factor N(5)-glutamine methyltransferase [Wenzhouxiangella sp.]|nr:peptide chain release factor N(5)-glutamine methyltransferase [Wenzhouxiangella sp.]
MTRITELLRQASEQLDSRLEAELLLSEAVQHPRAWLYAHGNEEIGSDEKARFQELLQRRSQGEPVAYILGRREFYGRTFIVSPEVLIPRPETELIVELALQHLDSQTAEIIDVGTGSGCIGLTLAAERPSWQVTAVDNCPTALRVCQANAEKLGLERVRLAESDLLTALADQSFDAIVSNPPYVAANDSHLTQGDLRFEPKQALSAGSDGLAIIRQLVRQSRRQLKPAGKLIIEHGYDQGPAVQSLMTAAGFVNATTFRDLAGIDRVTFAQQ